MALTPNSGSAPYLTPALFLTIVDLSLVQQLWLDGQDRTTPVPSQATLLTDPLVAFCLAAASGKVESAAVKGGKYAPSDLAALTGNSQALLQELVSVFAFEFLRRKRRSAFPPLPEYEDAVKTLEAIGNGDAVFSFAQIEAAGAPDIDQMSCWDTFTQPRPSNYRRAFGRPNSAAFGGGEF